MTYSKRAMDKVMSRKTKPDIYSFDVTEVGKQWGFIGEKRPYHHTPPINLVFAMREALNIVSEEGLENSWNRHLAAHYQLWEGLDKLENSWNRHLAAHYQLWEGLDKLENSWNRHLAAHY